MAFEGDRGTMANTLFPVYQRQASFNLGSGSNGSVPFISIPGVSLQEADKGSYVLWSHDVHDDPYKLINCAQNHFKNRKPSEVSDDLEMELQGLVSNILDEADSQDSLYSGGSLGEGGNNIWSPKTLQDELLQYFQTEANAQYNFAPNCISHNAFGKTQGQPVNKEAEELSNGFNNNQQTLFELPKGIQNFSQCRKSPPGLAIPPNMANTYLQLPQNNYENRPVPKDRANGENLGNFPDLSHVFKPQDNMNGGEYLYNDYNQAMDKPAVANDQYTSQDFNQLVSSFQSFVTGEQDSAEFGNVPTMIQHDEKWPSPTCFMEFDRSPQVQRQPGSDFVQSNGTRKQLFKRDSLQDLSSHSLQNTDCSPQQKISMRNNTNIIHRDNTSLHFPLNQYPKVQQSPLKFKPQMQSDRKRMSSYFGDSFNSQYLNGEIFPDEKQPTFYDFRSQRFDRDNHTISPQFSPIIYAHDPRRCPSPIPNPHFSPRGSLVYRRNMDVAEMTSEMSRFSSGLNGRRMESTFHGMPPPSPGNRGGPVLQLYFYLDEGYEQWRSLEKERKSAEIVLSKMFLGKRTSALPTSSLPKTPPNPSRIDRLIANQMREQALVSSLLDKMECLSSVAINPNIYNTLTKHHMAICVTSARRKEEILCMSQNQHQRGPFTDDRDSMMLVLAVKDLTVSTRKLRTAMWCALQTSLPQPIPETPVPEAPRDQTSPALCEGYSFRI